MPKDMWARRLAIKDKFLDHISMMRYDGYSRDEIAAAIRFARRHRKSAELIHEVGREHQRDLESTYRSW